MKNRLILILIFLKLSSVNLYAFSLFDDFKIQYLRGNSEYFSKSHSSIGDKTISDYQSFRLIYKNIGVAKSFNQLENTNIKSGYKAQASMEIYEIRLKHHLDAILMFWGRILWKKKVFLTGKTLSRKIYRKSIVNPSSIYGKYMKYA